MKPNVLVVDDEQAIRDLVQIYLNNEGLSVLQAATGAQALEIVRQQPVDLVILDIMMPGMDGIECCLKLREYKTIPVIMLSAKSQDIDKIWGLNVGADDYLTKPFNPLELVARVRSQLRRSMEYGRPAADDSSTITMGDLHINSATHQVLVAGQEAKLTRREFAILELLAKNPGMVFSSERIYQLVWNEPFYEADNTIMVHIRKIREKIEADPRRPRYIKTIWGVGYKLEQ